MTNTIPTSVSWTLNAGQCATRAYQMLGQLNPPDYTMDDGQWARAMDVENGLLKGLQVDGANVFRQTPTALTLTAGVATVPIPNDVIGIEEARFVVSSTFERPLGRFQWVDYWQLPTKNAQGVPTLFMFDYQQDSTQLYVWMVPQVSGTINCTTIRRALDITQQSDIVDLPDEWTIGYTYLLADALMDDQGMADMDGATAQRISERAQFWRERLNDFDRPSSIFLRPFGKRGRGRFWRG